MKLLNKKAFVGIISDLLSTVKKEEKDFLGKQKLDYDKAFNCKSCKIHFIPRKNQWIFYDLCDKCFYEFDSQKMKARLSRMRLPTEQQNFSPESVDWWISTRNK